MFDDVTLKCQATIPDTSISGRRVAREQTVLIKRRGKPMQNGVVKSCKCRMRDELFNKTMLSNMAHARIVISDWDADDNT